jgi:hypothetical protein
MMQFFTVQKLLSYQSATEESEGTIIQDAGGPAEAYGKHIDAIRPVLSHSLCAFLEGGSLHDGVLVAYRRRGRTASVWVRQDRGYDVSDRHVVELVLLKYHLDSDVDVEYYHDAGLVSPNGQYCAYDAEWLYDEVDVIPNGSFEHRILLRLNTAGPWACCMRFRFSRFEYQAELCSALWSEDSDQTDPGFRAHPTGVRQILRNKVT